MALVYFDIIQFRIEKLANTIPVSALLIPLILFSRLITLIHETNIDFTLLFALIILGMGESDQKNKI